MLRVFFYMAVPVSELCSILVADVDLEAYRVNQGNGSKDRYVLFGKSFATTLQTHIAAHPDSRAEASVMQPPLLVDACGCLPDVVGS